MIGLVWACLPALASTLSGRVVDSADGTPVSGATVEAWDPRLRGVSVTTDSDGAFAIPVDGEGPWRVRAVPAWNDPHLWRMHSGEADFCAGASVDATADVDLGDVALPIGATVTGRVVDLAGDPVPGATLWLEPVDEVVNFDRPGLTDADGEFSVVGVDVDHGGVDWTLVVGADGWPDQYLGAVYDDELGERVQPTFGAPVDVGEIDLLDGIFVGGLVSGPAGPVTEGTVHAYASSQIVTVEVDEDGRYEAIGLPPGDVITWANSPGLAQTYLPDADRPVVAEPVLEEGEVRDDLDLTLPEESIFEFTLADAETGDPIPGVGGLLYNDTQTVGLGNNADEQGLLRIDRLHGGDYKLYVWAADTGHTDGWIRDDDGLERIFTIDSAVTESIELPLPRAARLAGRVVDEDGEPVDGIAIAALREDLSGLATTSAPDGSFVLGGLGAGEWQVSAEYGAICPGDPGYVALYWPGTVNPDWARTMSLTEGEQREELVLVVARDADLDEMSDDWEREHSLDPTRAEDAWEDPDRDGYVNLDEYRMGTDPHDGTPEVETCGCTSAPRQAPFLLALLLPVLARRPE